jgi:hypothetical protein
VHQAKESVSAIAPGVAGCTAAEARCCNGAETRVYGDQADGRDPWARTERQGLYQPPLPLSRRCRCGAAGGKNRTKSRILPTSSFGYAKVHYRGLVKNRQRRWLSCGLANLFIVRRRLPERRRVSELLRPPPENHGKRSRSIWQTDQISIVNMMLECVTHAPRESRWRDTVTGKTATEILHCGHNGIQSMEVNNGGANHRHQLSSLFGHIVFEWPDEQTVIKHACGCFGVWCNFGETVAH